MFIDFIDMFIGRSVCVRVLQSHRKDRERDGESERLLLLQQAGTPSSLSPAPFLPHTRQIKQSVISMAAANGTRFSAPAVDQLLTNTSSSSSGSSSSWQDEAVRGIQIVATLLIFLVGVSLNGLVVWALGMRGNRHLVRRGSNEETRAANSFRIYVLHLAVADLVLILRTPLMLGYIAYNYSWPFGLHFCRLVMFLRGMGLYASAFLLCAVALERCLCLLKPVWARLRRPYWAVPLACGILWLVAFILSTPYLNSAFLMEKNGTYHCVESGAFDMALFVTETTAGFILPLLVFLGSNLAVLLTIHQAVPLTPTTSTPSTARRMTRMYHVLFFTMLLFLTCWVPYFVCRFVRALADGRPDRITLYKRALKGTYISLFLVYIKCALNPVLYVFAARGLGRAIKASLVSTIERLFNEDSMESIRRKSLKNSLKNSQM